MSAPRRGPSIDGVTHAALLKPPAAERRPNRADKVSARPLTGRLSTLRTSIAASAAKGVAAKADDLEDGPEVCPSGNMNSLQALIALFCYALSAGVALCPQYPRQAGWLGFVIAICVVGVVSSVSECAVYEACRVNRAATFTDLCKDLPGWMVGLTAWSQVFWGLVGIALCSNFVFDSLVIQIYEKSPKEMGFSDMAYAEYVRETAPLYACVFAVNFLLGIPSNLKTPAAEFFFSHLNCLVILTVIVLGVVKGSLVISELDEPLEYHMFAKGGFWTAVGQFMKICAMLSGSMNTTYAIPWLHSEIRPESQERGGKIAAVGVTILQGGTFIALGLTGYFATGHSEVNVFESEGNDMQIRLRKWLQLGLMVLMGLTVPLWGLPTKAEMWRLLQQTWQKKGEAIVAFEDSSCKMQMLLNLAVSGIGVAIPLFLRSKVFMDSILPLLCGTIGNWLSLGLVCFVLTYSSVLPSLAKGEPVKGMIFKIAVIASLAISSTIFSCVEIVGKFFQSTSPPTPT